MQVELEVARGPQLLALHTLGDAELLARAFGERDVLDRERDAHVDRVLVGRVELGERQLLDQSTEEAPARALVVIEIGRDDGAALARAFTGEELGAPVVER